MEIRSEYTWGKETEEKAEQKVPLIIELTSLRQLFVEGAFYLMHMWKVVGN